MLQKMLWAKGLQSMYEKKEQTIFKTSIDLIYILINFNRIYFIYIYVTLFLNLNKTTILYRDTNIQNYSWHTMFVLIHTMCYWK